MINVDKLIGSSLGDGGPISGDKFKKAQCFGN